MTRKRNEKRMDIDILKSSRQIKEKSRILNMIQEIMRLSI